MPEPRAGAGDVMADHRFLVHSFHLDHIRRLPDQMLPAVERDHLAGKRRLRQYEFYRARDSAGDVPRPRSVRRDCLANSSSSIRADGRAGPARSH